MIVFRKLSVLTFVFLITQCKKPTFDLVFFVNDHFGVPVRNSKIELDNKIVGVTGEDGSLTISYPCRFSPKTRLLKVSKKTHQLYYKTYYKHVVLRGCRANTLLIKLYYKNKPKHVNNILLYKKNLQAEFLQESAEISFDFPYFYTDVFLLEKDKKHYRASYRDKNNKNILVKAFARGSSELGSTVVLYDYGNNQQQECLTNSQGVCVFKGLKCFENCTLVVSKNGFLTRRIFLKKNQKNYNIRLKKGISFDFFVRKNSLSTRSFAKNTNIYVNYRFVGTTDRNGFFSYHYRGKSKDIAILQIRPTDKNQYSYSKKIKVNKGYIWKRDVFFKNISQPLVSFVYNKKNSHEKVVKYLSRGVLDFSYQEPVVLSKAGESDISIEYVHSLQKLKNYVVLFLKNKNDKVLYSNISWYKGNKVSEKAIRVQLKELLQEFPMHVSVKNIRGKNVLISGSNLLSLSYLKNKKFYAYGEVDNRDGSGSRSAAVAFANPFYDSKSRKWFFRLFGNKKHSHFYKNDQILKFFILEKKIVRNKDSVNLVVENKSQDTTLGDVSVYRGSKWLGQTNSQGRIVVHNSSKISLENSLVFVNKKFKTQVLSKLSKIKDKVYLDPVKNVKKIRKKTSPYFSSYKISFMKAKDQSFDPRYVQFLGGKWLNSLVSNYFNRKRTASTSDADSLLFLCYHAMDKVMNFVYSLPKNLVDENLLSHIKLAKSMLFRETYRDRSFDLRLSAMIFSSYKNQRKFNSYKVLKDQNLEFARAVGYLNRRHL